MNTYLTIDANLIMREKEKMLFSAKNMKIYKFNDRGFNILKILYDNKKITKSELLNLVNASEYYSEEEFNNLIDKMLSAKIILEENE